jgi:hypothetical protein
MRTYKTEFPGFDNGPLFESLLARLAPFGFTDSSWVNDTCPSISSPELDGGIFVTIHVEFIHGSEFEVSPADARIFVNSPDIPGSISTPYADAESAIADALRRVADTGHGARDMPLDFGGLGITQSRAFEFIRDMQAAGLLWHMDDSPEGIGNPAKPGDLSTWQDVFSPEQCERLAPVQLAMRTLDSWGRFEDVHGYCIAVVTAADNATPVALDGFAVWETGGGCRALGKNVAGGLQFLITDESGCYVPTFGEAIGVGLYSQEHGDELQSWDFAPGEFSPGRFAEIERKAMEKFADKESGK